MEKFNNKQILEKYQNFKQLGQGAVSAIFYAESKQTSQSVAIKVVTKQKIANDKQENQYYKQELEITKAIIAKGNNENIVNILELIEGTNEYFIVTEYYKDGDLFNLLERFSFKFSPDVAISFCISIANGLSFLHSSKICHRDLKPENILIAKQADDSFLIKIADFGISKISENMMKSTVGTITYMAPEILKYQPYDERVDIWTFGCLLYEIFTGEQLFGGNTIKDVALKITGFQEDSLNQIPSSKIPKSVIQIIKKCLKRQPAQRISLEQIIKDLLQAKTEIKVNMTQSVFLSQEKDNKYNISELQKEMVGKTPQPSIKFTDNQNDSFDNYTDDIHDTQEKDSNTNNLKDFPLQITKVESQSDQNQQELDDTYYITPKNNNLQNQNFEQSEDKNQQMKLKKLEEEQKNKKMYEKEKNNLIMQQQVEQNQLLQKLTTNQDQIIPQNNIEQSIVLEKKTNPNFVNIHIQKNLTPQPAKSNLDILSNYPYSDQKLYEFQNNNSNNYLTQKTQNITPFNYANNNFTSNETKVDNLKNIPTQINYLPQYNTPQNNQQYTNNFMANKIQQQKQTNSKGQQDKFNYLNNIQINEPQYPIFDQVSSLISNQNDLTQQNKLQQSPSYTSKQFQDQVSKNNQSEDVQSVLQLYASSSQSQKQKQNKKTEVKVTYELNQQEIQKIFQEINSCPYDPLIQFYKDSTKSTYEFKKVYFDDLNQELQCVEITSSQDINILEFINFIFNSFEQQRDKKENLLQKFIGIIYKNQDYYISFSDFIKQNSQQLIVFLKSLHDILLMDKTLDKYNKLYQFTLNSQFQGFLCAFGSLLQIYKDKQDTEQLHLETKDDIIEIDKFIKEKIPFKLVIKQNQTKKQYFVHFINTNKS
ncbi:hypothetical protein ABPG72_001401 [Tetrahymena utriculariae]